jgi:hypothetical protein
MFLSAPDLKSGIPTYDRRRPYMLKLTPKCEALQSSDDQNVGGRQETTQIKWANTDKGMCLCIY